jgi:cytochrome c-type biogenesis protein CcmH
MKPTALTPFLLALGFTAMASACKPAEPQPAASATPAASTLPPGHPPVDAGAAPAGSEATLPPGHPPTGGGAGAAMPPGHPPLGASGDKSAPAAPPVAGTVTLGPAVAGRAVGAKALYVIARQAGTRDIVAVKKLDAPTFPLAFKLAGDDVMVAGTAFSGPFDLTARLTKTGDAIPTAGDIEGAAKNVAAGSKGVTITLDSVRQ